MVMRFLRGPALVGAVALALTLLGQTAQAQWCGPCRTCVPCQPCRPYSQSGLPTPGRPTPVESMLSPTPGDIANGDPEATPSATNDMAPMGDPSAALNQPGANDLAFDAGVGGGAAGNTDMGGYINQASLQNRVRFRYDKVNGGNTDAAEFLYGAYFINGRPAIQNYDYQDASTYIELMMTQRLSLFVEGAYRFAQYNDFGLPGGPVRRETGFTDMNAGARYAVIDDGCEFLTAQLKVFVPTGDTNQGLGTGHVSLEPGALYQRDYDRLHVFGEVHDWVSLSDLRVPPIFFNFPAGTLYGGNVLRYGLGAGYDVGRNCDRKLTLLGEVVGWTVLYGLRNDVFGAGGVLADAAGDTVVNVKAGVRYTQGYHSLYVGYGVPISRFEWYDSLLRVDYTYAGW